MSARGIFLVLTSAIALDGALCRAGTLVEVTDTEAKNLLHRGKARLATEADMPPGEVVTGQDEAEAAAEAEAKAKAEAEAQAAAEAAAKAEAEAEAKAKAAAEAEAKAKKAGK